MSSQWRSAPIQRILRWRAGPGARLPAPVTNRDSKRPHRLDHLQPKPLKEMAPGEGFEPPARRLTAACSTTELPGIRAAVNVAARVITNP